MGITPDKLLEQAEGYLELDLPAEALKVLAQVDPDSRDQFAWHMFSAEAQRALQHHREALGHFENAHLHQPDAVDAYLGMAWCHKRLNQLEKAISAMLEAVDCCQEKSNKQMAGLVMYNLSCYYSLDRQLGPCLRWLLRAIESDSKYRALVDSESDFDPLRHKAEFQKMLGKSPRSSSTAGSSS